MTRVMLIGACLLLVLLLAGCVETRFESPPGDNIETCDARWKGLWIGADAKRRGELDPGVDPADLAFELDALGMAANLHARLCDDPSAYDRARAAMRARLRALATAPHPALA